MSGSGTGMGWGGRIAVGVALIIVGAAAAVWGLAHYGGAARLLGVVPVQQQIVRPPAQPALKPAPQIVAAPAPAAQNQQQSQQIADVEARLTRVENAMAAAQGSAGRADALVIAFAARRAIDRGVALGYLENLLVGRFAGDHRAAVATVITASHQPVRLDDLIAEYDTLGPDLRRGSPQDSWWTNLRRGLGNLVEIHSADQPASNPEARYEHARQRLAAGDVEQALAETMRLPGASRAGDWVSKARRYIAAHRALDEIESAALMPGPNPPA